MQADYSVKNQSAPRKQATMIPSDNIPKRIVPECKDKFKHGSVTIVAEKP